MSVPTRTIGPLHFEDLEPHRFEDLVRQLAYSFRSWEALEAIGRSGSDGGVDIRAMEKAQESADDSADDGDEVEGKEAPRPGRSWLIQCKREKTMPPAKARQVVVDALASHPIPYGLALAAACDFSLKARSAFREAALEAGVTEVAMWGKAELEDMLYRPENGHLLFAYFGVALHVRRASLRAVAAARLATKRRLTKVLGPLNVRSDKAVMVRDIADGEYPRPKDAAAFKKNPRWRYYHVAEHQEPDYLAVVVVEHFARLINADKTWDAILGAEIAWHMLPETALGPDRRESDSVDGARRYWLVHVPTDERAKLRKIGYIRYDRIVLVDDIGDSWHAGPHLLLDCPDGELFDGHTWVVEDGSTRIVATKESRRDYFPVPLPPVTDAEYQAACAVGFRTERGKT